MPRVVFLTHPQVVVDPAVPVPGWGLSEVGRARAAALAGGAWLRDVTSVWSSDERKAIECADLLAGALPRQRHTGLGENDRSATGFVPPAEFEALADAFFAEPSCSVRGWATAADEQERIVAAVEDVLADPASGDGDVVIVSHGAVGTLLWCALSGVPIARAYDQPGQGHFYTFDRDTRRVLSGWRPLDEVAGQGDESGR